MAHSDPFEERAPKEEGMGGAARIPVRLTSWHNVVASLAGGLGILFQHLLHQGLPDAGAQCGRPVAAARPLPGLGASRPARPGLPASGVF